MQKYLKLFMVALLATVTMAFVSCGKDEVNSDNLVGTWKVGGAIASISETIGGAKIYVQFRADGTFVGVSVLPNVEEGEPVAPDLGEGRYTLSGKKLTAIVDGQEIVLTIDKLTNKTLVISGFGEMQHLEFLKLLGTNLELVRVPDSEIEPYINK